MLTHDRKRTELPAGRPRDRGIFVAAAAAVGARAWSVTSSRGRPASIGLQVRRRRARRRFMLCMGMVTWSKIKLTESLDDCT